MPSFDSPIPPNHRRFRLYGLSVMDKTTRNFVVPRFEIGIIKAGWPGIKVVTTDMADFIDLPDDANVMHRTLVARYGAEAVARYHPSAERLAEDMDREAEATATFIEKCTAAADAEERKRVAAERAARAAVAETAKAGEQKAK